MDFTFSKTVKSASYDDIDYSEPLRTQFHFTSGKNWFNDPSGMVYDGEKYHLFFQHNPNGTKWGNMTWGHATSLDMMHWTQHKHSLLPYSVDGHSGIFTPARQSLITTTVLECKKETFLRCALSSPGLALPNSTKPWLTVRTVARPRP